MKPKSYNYRRNVSREEVFAHVRQATRDLPDPIFLSLASEAANHGINSNQHYYGANVTGAKGLTFHYPTTHPRGYFSLLQYIIANPSCTRRQIYDHFHAPLVFTLKHLLDAKLITFHTPPKLNPDGTLKFNRKHQSILLPAQFQATELGITYALVAQNYLTQRKSSLSQYSTPEA